MRRRLKFVWYEIVHWFTFIAYMLAFSLRLAGKRNMPRQGPVLVIANHQSFLDPNAIGLACRRHLVYLARKTLFQQRILALLMRSLNAVPIDQDGVAKEGLKTIIDQLKAGRAVLVFPEGERALGSLQQLKPGIHLVIKRVPVPIVPVGIAGFNAAWPRHSPLPSFAPLFLPPTARTMAISVGKALDGKRFAAFVVCRRCWSINLKTVRKLGTANGGDYVRRH